jgi:2,3-diketo-5-methylthio-1-phosphopentane phosphatase
MGDAFLFDFDGTVTTEDIGARFVTQFGSGPADELNEALARWRRGELGHRELTLIECRRLRVTEDEALRYARGFGLDPEFVSFARDVAAAGHEVGVASEGFEFYIDDLLGRSGLGGMPRWANRLRFENGGAVPEFPHPGGCGRCGNCKGERVREHQRRGRRVVFAGDGLSDRCGARAADRVFARGDLLAWCRSEGIDAQPLVSFGSLRRALERDASAPPPARRAGGGGA